MKPLDYLTLAGLVLILPIAAQAGEVALYNNTHLPPDPPPFAPPNAPPPFADASTTHMAIQFYTADTDNVTTAAVTMKRTGSPGGQLHFEIWDTGEDGFPGQSVGTLNSLDTNSLPEELELVTVRGAVNGLSMRTRYYLVIRNVGTTITGGSQTFHTAPLFAGGHTNAGPGVPDTPEGGPLQQALSRDNDDWLTISEALGGAPPGWLHARIGGKPSNEAALYDNTHLPADPPPFVPPNAPPPFADANTTHTAIQFDTGPYDNVSSASITLKRTGLPGGALHFEIWSADEDGYPESSVGTLGTVPLNGLPVSLGLVDVQGSVPGLQPNTRYYLMLHNVGTDVTGPDQTFHIAPLFPGNHANAGPGTPLPADGKPLMESLYRENGNGEWKTLTSALGAPPGAWQHGCIAAAISNNPPINYDDAVLQDKPISFWRLNEMPGSEKAEDQGSVATEGTYKGIGLGKPSATPALGTAGEWVRHPGNSHIDFGRFNVGSMSQLANIGEPADADGKFTSLEFWIKTPAVGNHIHYWRTQTLFGNDAGRGGDVRWAILTPFGQLGLDILGSSFQRHLHLSEAVVSDDSWHHIVITYDWGQGISNIYIDGALDSTLQTTGGSNQGSDAGIRYLGWDSSGEHNPHDTSIPVLSQFAGLLDEVAIYDHELNADRVRAHFEAAHQSEDPSIHLTLGHSANGRIEATPRRETYSPGSHVTLHAKPNFGFAFAGWAVNGQSFRGNPLTIVINHDTGVSASFVPIPDASLYDNTSLLPGFAMPQFPDRNAVAQAFMTNDTGEVRAVSVSLARANSIQGTLSAQIWTSGEDGLPEAMRGTVGEIDVKELPTFAQLVTVQGSVTDLEPNTRHFLVLAQSDDMVISDEPRFLRDTFYYRIRTGASGTPWMEGDADNDVLLRNVNGTWSRLYEEFQTNAPELTDTPVYVYAKIVSPVPTTIRLDALLVPSDHGSVSIDPMREAYTLGAEVTVTATPVEGYAFAQWLYGDEEITNNPATVTVRSHATLTPVFAEIDVPQPLNIDIASAVAIGWDSQTGKVYQIYASKDLENWDLTEDNIQGTGQRLTHSFIRADTKVFYRVEERR